MTGRIRSIALSCALAVSIVALFVTAASSGAKSTRPNMSLLSPRMASIFATTRTICFGRMLIDVPATAVVVFGPAEVDTRITRYPDEAARIEQHMAEVLTKIDEDRSYLEKEFLTADSMYGKILDGSVPGHKLVVGESSGFYKLHSFIPLGNDLFVLQDHSISPRGTELQDEISNQKSTAKRMRSRAEGDVPTEDGSCIDGAFIAGPAQYEIISLGVRLKEYPDVHFSIDMRKNQKFLSQGGQIEQRLRLAEKNAIDAGEGAWLARIKFFRRGPRKLHQWEGAEVLARKPAQKEAGESHHFAYYSSGEPDAPLQAAMDIQLETGVEGNRSSATKPGLSDEEAIELWDVLLESIRVRPIGELKSSDAAIPPLGTYASAGQPCPHGGWWECSEGGAAVDIVGGRRQYFRTQESMPQATLLTPRSLWQRVKGEHPTFQSRIATVWKLAKYDNG